MACQPTKRRHKAFSKSKYPQTQVISKGKDVREKYRREKNPMFGWAAKNRPLDIPSDNFSSAPSRDF